MRKKVALVTFAATWNWQGKDNHNFVIKFDDAKDEGDKIERYVYVSSENPQTKFVVGQDVDFEMSKDKENKQKTIKVTLGGKSFEFDKIEPAKAAFGGFGGGGGGGKSFVKSKEQYSNELVGYVGGYCKDILAHRINLGGTTPESIVEAYEKLVDGTFKALVKHIK